MGYPGYDRLLPKSPPKSPKPPKSPMPLPKPHIAPMTREDVVGQFLLFILAYRRWRNENGLSYTIDNVHEICNAMTDKHGRICRQIKHISRSDPKDDWPLGMTEAMTGYLVYMNMLLEKYDISISDGMLHELEEAVKQHSKKGKKKSDGMLHELEEAVKRHSKKSKKIKISKKSKKK